MAPRIAPRSPIRSDPLRSSPIFFGLAPLFGRPMHLFVAKRATFTKHGETNTRSTFARFRDPPLELPNGPKTPLVTHRKPSLSKLAHNVCSQESSGAILGFPGRLRGRSWVARGPPKTHFWTPGTPPGSISGRPEMPEDPFSGAQGHFLRGAQSHGPGCIPLWREQSKNYMRTCPCMLFPKRKAPIGASGRV